MHRRGEARTPPIQTSSSMQREALSTHQKAFQINLDPTKYGTFAEIGAGQEVARWFFRVGGAAGTIAKTISAYDMTVSDAIYGKADRYVSRRRLDTMLEHEFGLLQERLAAKRGETTRFFAFADTVVARSFSRQEDGQGWMGVRFQTQPRGEPSQIVIHVRLLDGENLQEQEALGIVGVNLIHSALYLHAQPEAMLVSLLDSLTSERVEIDMVDVSGPAFKGVDNRLLSLCMVHSGLTNAAMFKPSGGMIQPADAFYKKAVLVERGNFRPATNITVDMIDCALAQFIQEPGLQGEGVEVLFEMTMRSLTTEQGVNPKDFLDRVDILSSLGKTVMISNFGAYYRLAAYLFRYTQKKIGIVMGVPSLREIFEEKYYNDLGGGILESFGRLFKNDLKLYAYPYRDPKTRSLITAENLLVAPHLRHLHAYLLENRFIEPLLGFNAGLEPIHSKDVVEKIRAGDPTWEKFVPMPVAQVIKDRRLFLQQAA